MKEKQPRVDQRPDDAHRQRDQDITSKACLEVLQRYRPEAPGHKLLAATIIYLTQEEIEHNIHCEHGLRQNQQPDLWILHVYLWKPLSTVVRIQDSLNKRRQLFDDRPHEIAQGVGVDDEQVPVQLKPFGPIL